jgi:hypothetical protein
MAFVVLSYCFNHCFDNFNVILQKNLPFVGRKSHMVCFGKKVATRRVINILKEQNAALHEFVYRHQLLT